MSGLLKLQVELFCPTHTGDSISSEATANHRTLSVFKTRVSTAQQARRDIVATLKRHIPSLNAFESLKVTFRSSASAGPVSKEKAKREFEAAVTAALANETVLTLQVQPVQDPYPIKKICYCAPVTVASSSATSKRSSEPAKAAKSSSVKDNSTATGPSSKQSPSQDQVKAELAQMEKGIVEKLAAMNAKTLETSTRYADVVARLTQLEADHKALQTQYEASQKQASDATVAISAATAAAMATAKAASTAAAAKEAPIKEAIPPQGNLNPRFQTFCNDLLKNLNASMRSNFGDEAGTSTFDTAAPSSKSSDKVGRASHSHGNCCHSKEESKSLGAAPAQAPRSDSARPLTGPTIMPRAGGSFYCDICKRLASGEDRYRCLRCPDWDACKDCCRFGLHEHGHSIYTFIAKDEQTRISPAFGQSCTACHDTPRDGVLYHNSRVTDKHTSSMCADCFPKVEIPASFFRIQPLSWTPALDGPALPHGARLPHARSASAAEAARVKQAKLTYFCDICREDIKRNEWRYNCASCKDFDACQTCYDSCKVDLHQHAGFIEYAPSTSPSRISENSAGHNAICDLCEQRIDTGCRLKCLQCPDFDVCDKPGCVGMLPIEHAGHRFVRIEQPSMLRRYGVQGGLLGQPFRSTGYRCDGCDAPITGTRYACLACEDFDLCGNCEALPLTDPSSSRKKHTKETGISHQRVNGPDHLFVKVPPSEGNGFSRVQAADRVRKIIYNARQGVAKLVQSSVPQAHSQADDTSADSDATETNSTVPVHWCGTALLLAEQERQATLRANKARTSAASSAASELKPAAAELLHDVVVKSSTLPQSPARSQSKAATVEDASESDWSSRGAATCTVEHSMEPPKNDRLSYEEKRVLSSRIAQGGSAAVNAFVSVLTPEQQAQVSTDGDLVFELDDLTVEQYSNVMVELDVLDISARDQAVKEEPKVAAPDAPAQMSELSCSFKTIRPSPIFDDVPSEHSSEASGFATPQDDNRLDLDAEFVEDVSMPDGTIVAAGSRFDKIWRIRNSGKKAWPAEVQLKFVAGDTMGLSGPAGSVISNITASPYLNRLPPGAECQIRLSSLKAMDFAGRSTAYFRLVGRNSLGHDVAFGHQLWLDLDVRTDTDADDSSTAPTANTSATPNDNLSGGSSENSTGRLGGSSVLAAPHAPESVRSDTGVVSVAGSVASPQSPKKAQGRASGGYRLGDDSDSEDSEDETYFAKPATARNPFEDAVAVASDDDDEAVSEDSDFELVDPTTEESDIE